MKAQPNTPDEWLALLALLTGTPDAHVLSICRLCTRWLGVTGGGVSIVTAAGNRGRVCATDSVSAQIEDLQFSLGEGPCVDAVSTGSPVLVGDLASLGDVTGDRWPVFLEAAQLAGVRAVFSFPLRIGAIRVGSMDLYRDSPGDLSAGELSAALVAADAAAFALLQPRGGGGDQFMDNPETRTSYRLEVHQATGMVQVQLGVTTEAAFLLLCARAYAVGRTVADLSLDVVERRVRFAPEEP